MVIGPDSFFHRRRHLVLGSIRSRDKRIQTCEFKKATHQTDSTRTEQCHHKVGCDDQSMYKSNTPRAFKKRNDIGVGVNGAPAFEPISERRFRNPDVLSESALTQAFALVKGRFEIGQLGGDLCSVPFFFIVWPRIKSHIS